MSASSWRGLRDERSHRLDGRSRGPDVSELSNLSIALNPQSIAIVGASDNPDKIGGRCLSYVKKFGFRGSIYPINPTRELTQGVKTYPSFEALPGVADLAVICVPGEQAVEAVES